MQYRREIDGLRALAVLPVILFHAGIAGFSGGFVGVDIFLVISGYLITTLIVAELEQGRFSIARFYERRARRILPALFLVMLVAIPPAWILLSPEALTSFSKSLVAVTLFVSNFFFWKDGGYFETAAELKPLLHTWSLAVEEQFYVFFPLLLLFFWRHGRRFVFWLVVLTALASLALAQVGCDFKPVLNYFMLPSRAWELAIGAIVALHMARPEAVPPALKSRQVLAAGGLVLILASITCFDGATPFPSAWGLLPTLGAAAIILFAQGDTRVGRLLGSSVLVGTGLISYSAYLWHQPVLAFARLADPSLGAAATIALLGLIFGLAALSWRFVETPFRSKRGVGRRAILAGSLVASLAFLVVGGLGSRIAFNNERAMAEALASGVAIYASNMDERQFVKARAASESMQPRTIVLGSSRIMQVGTRRADNPVLNLAVSGGSVEDDLAIWKLASSRFHPAVILVGADPWLFNARSGQDRWKSLAPDYASALTDLGLDPGPPAAAVPSHGDSLAGLARLFYAVNISKVRAADDAPGALDKIRRDGSRVYNLAYANKPAREVERGAESFASYAMAPYEFSPASMAIFEAFIDRLKRDHEVVLVLTPFHPTLYGFMQSQDRKFIRIERQFRDLASTRGVRIVGSYDPAQVGCVEADFLDGMHPRDGCMERILGPLR